jgi:uncharacterized protein DUF1573
MKSHIIFAFLSVFIAAAVHAELKWDETILELHPAFGDKDAVGHFKYQNVGKTPVHLTSVKTSCGCTVAKSQKDQVEPGEKGEITATFNIGNHVGTQVKTVTVQTDDPTSPPTVLTLKAVLPEGLTLMPTFVFWKTGEKPGGKTIIVKAGKDFLAKNIEVHTSTPEFGVTVEPAKGGGSWKINVTPKQTEHNVSAVITVKTDFPKDSPGVFYANAGVVGSPAGQPPTSAPQR